MALPSLGKLLGQIEEATRAVSAKSVEGTADKPVATGNADAVETADAKNTAVGTVQPVKANEVAIKPEIRLDEVRIYEVPSFTYETSTPQGVYKVVVPASKITTNVPSQSPEDLTVRKGIVLPGISGESRPEPRESFVGGRAYVQVVEYAMPNGSVHRVIIANRPAEGKYHPAQDAVGVSVSYLDYPDYENYPVFSAVLADGNTNVEIPADKYNAKAHKKTGKGSDDSHVFILAPYSAMYANMAARNAHRVVANFGRNADTLDFLINEVHKPEYKYQYGATTVQLLGVGIYPDAQDAGVMRMAAENINLGSDAGMNKSDGLKPVSNFGGLAVTATNAGKFDEVVALGNRQDLSHEGRRGRYTKESLQATLTNQPIPYGPVMMWGDGVHPDLDGFANRLGDIVDMSAEELVQQFGNGELLDLLGTDKDDQTFVMFVPAKAAGAIAAPANIVTDTASSEVDTGGVAPLSGSVQLPLAVDVSEAALPNQVETEFGMLREVRSLVMRRLGGDAGITFQDVARAAGVEVEAREVDPAFAEARAFFEKVLGHGIVEKALLADPDAILFDFYSALKPLYDKLDALHHMVEGAWEGQGMKIDAVEELFGFAISPEKKRAYLQKLTQKAAEKPAEHPEQETKPSKGVPAKAKPAPKPTK